VVTLSDVNARLGLELSDDDYDTIGGHVFGAIGRMPRVGDGINGNGYRLCVEELDGRRVSVVRYVPTSEMVTTGK
jgi:putative hemolysin